ncbi:hypothetical protein [Marinomonas algicola]|uniref:hypothetical protein n=1 Tax=Marinomonas algicola TaxID=2773454 RepID=UPI00174E1269|nr:hypothetical protein [Marinomonas algicola]
MASIISEEHIRNSHKALVLRGRPSAYLKTFRALRDQKTISTGLYDFLYTCCESTDSELALIEDEKYILLDQTLIESYLSKRDLPSSRGTLVQRFKGLVEARIAVEEECIYKHHQRSYRKKIYVIPPPFEVSGLIEDTKEAPAPISDILTLPTAVHEVQRELVNSHMSPSREVITKILNDSVSVLAKPWLVLGQAWRQSSRHKFNREDGISISVNNTPVNIRASSTNDIGVATIDEDILALTIITNMIFETLKQQISLEIQPSNTFFIDIVDVCRIAKAFQKDNPDIKPREYSAGSIRKQYVRSLMRLNHTNNHIIIGDHANSIQARHLLGLSENTNFYNKRFITELEAQLDTIEPGSNAEPRWFKISVDSDTYNGMLNAFQDKNSLLVIAHSELLGYTNNGIIFLLYQFLNVHIGRTNKESNAGFKTFTTTQLHRYLAPNGPENTFSEILLQGAKSLFSKGTTTGKWNDNGVNQVCTLGFHMIFHTANCEIISSIFSRDRADRITGDKSKHNRLIKKQMIDLNGTNVELKAQSVSPSQQQLFDNSEEAASNEPKPRKPRPTTDSQYLPASDEERRKLNRADVNEALTNIEDTNW